MKSAFLNLILKISVTLVLLTMKTLMLNFLLFFLENTCSLIIHILFYHISIEEIDKIFCASLG